MAEDKKDELEAAEIKEIERIDDSQDSDSNEPVSEQPMKIKKPSKLKNFLSSRKGKILTTLGVIIIAVAVIFAIPTTRYAVAGSFMKKDVRVSVVDATTSKPVSDADVKLGEQTVKTSATGEATFKSIPVGSYTVAITKKYYKDTSLSYTVPILSSPVQLKADLQATGRQVEVRVANLVTKGVLSKASVVVGGTSAITDDKGIATVVLPADQKALSATVSLVGYNDKKVSIVVTEQAGKNNVTLTPEGKLFYLSNQTGTINVMKSDLDGTSATVVVKGTGNEDQSNTALLAARDWRYMTLLARRDVNLKNQLYVIDARTNELKVIDQGNVEMNLVGWSNHKFIYWLLRDNKKSWENGRNALKSYDADTGKLSTLYETKADGTGYSNYATEGISSTYILDNKLVFGLNIWAGEIRTANRKASIVEMDADGSNKRILKEFQESRRAIVEGRLYEPQEISYRVTIDDGNATFYSYENGAVTSVSNSDTRFYSAYPTYLISPSGSKSFWYEYRDGKNTLFVGDKSGKNGTMIASLSDYSTYGWFSDDYLLLSKGGSELYIVAANKPISGDNQPVRITNYFKPGINYPGYGYGYGGI